MLIALIQFFNIMCRDMLIWPAYSQNFMTCGILIQNANFALHLILCSSTTVTVSSFSVLTTNNTAFINYFM